MKKIIFLTCCIFLFASWYDPILDLFTNATTATIDASSDWMLFHDVTDGKKKKANANDIVSATASYAEAYIESSDPDTVTVTTAGTEVALADVSSGGAVNFTVGADGKLTYTGAATATFHVSWTATITSNATNENLIGFLKDNDGTYTRVRWEEEDAATSDRHSVAAQGIVSLDQNDWIAPFIDCETNGTQVEVLIMSIVIRKL